MEQEISKTKSENAKYKYLALATATTLVCGMMYNLTVFSDAISATLNIGYSTISMVFSLSQICFCIGGFILGIVFNKVKFRFSMIVASITMGSGLMLSSQASEPWQLFVFYSICMNLSAGFICKSILSAVLPWFQENPGLASGVVLMGPGLTAFVFNYPTAQFIPIIGWRSTMLIIGVLVLLITMVAANNLKAKTYDEAFLGKDDIDQNPEFRYSTRQIISTPKFIFIFTWAVLMLAGCTTVAGNAVSISNSFGVDVAIGAIFSMVISFANATSRIWYGCLYDNYGRKISMGISTGCFFAGILLLEVAILMQILNIMFFAFIFIGIAFGGIPTITSTFTLNVFGRKNYARNYGVVGMYALFAPILGTTVFSVLYGITSNYLYSLSFLVGYAIFVIVTYLTLNKVGNNK
ncbi:MAG: MFS transporter [Anaerorhabdus sp.]